MCHGLATLASAHVVRASRNTGLWRHGDDGAGDRYHHGMDRCAPPGAVDVHGLDAPRPCSCGGAGTRLANAHASTAHLSPRGQVAEPGSTASMMLERMGQPNPSAFCLIFQKNSMSQNP